MKNKTILITGAARGIGKATAQLLLAEGAQVALTDIDTEHLRDTMHQLGTDNALYAKADVTQLSEISAVVDETLETFGKIDGVFCNAGIGGAAHFFWEYPPAAFACVIEVNLMGVLYTMQAAMPSLMKQGGSILITSSIAGLAGMPKGAAYSASKHAVVGLAKSAAVEAARYGVRVNTIHPGPVETDMVRLLETAINPQDAAKGKERLKDAIPMRRYATAEEIAHLALFLLSDESRYITGAEYRIDGGMQAV
ncbi:MAG: SDR family NAD(P)-dependent oxidoreductase [Cytophagales bacterium]|nr:SDR family oxidoreductase [Bernardetiaceae bacterium]MDW8204979.1 SDR family NAD(P)-dependent oxidoreductase [Cytophagales bacterium]